MKQVIGLKAHCPHQSNSSFAGFGHEADRCPEQSSARIGSPVQRACPATLRARAFPVLRPRHRLCGHPRTAPVWQSVAVLRRPGRHAFVLSGCPRVPTDPPTSLTVFDDDPVAVSARGIARARRAPPCLLSTPPFCRARRLPVTRAPPPSPPVSRALRRCRGVLLPSVTCVAGALLHVCCGPLL